MLFLLSVMISYSTPALAASPLEMHCQMVFARRTSRRKIVPGILVSSVHKPDVFKIFDLRNDFYFHAKHQNGVLEINAYLSDSQRRLRSGLQGERLYREMMEHFGPENIQVIVGRWSEGTNYERYMTARQRGASMEEAAWATWSGKQAALHGFTQIRFIDQFTLEDTFGTQVYVEFVKPERPRDLILERTLDGIFSETQLADEE